MTPHAIGTGDITADDLDLLDWVRRDIAAMRDGLDCHQVCNHLAQASSLLAVGIGLTPPNLRHVRGYFAHKGWDHSWLAVRDRPILIDPYPWCCGSGPILVYTGGTLNPWRNLYVET